MKPAEAAATHTRSTALPLRTDPKGRHLVDVTLLFTPTSGGVRRYLLAKHRWLQWHTHLKHTVLVPGHHTAGLPWGVMSFASPLIPLGSGYRVPLRMRAFREQLARLTPNLLEVGDPYHLAWHALRVARERRIPTVAFCHSDLVALAGSLLGTTAGRAASRYLAQLYAGFDLVLAPSATVAERLIAAGVRNVGIQPLGVDVEALTPRSAESSIREMLGIPPHARLLVFAGRISPEKRTGALVAALELLGPAYHLLLVGSRRPGRRHPNVTALEYQQDQRQLARILASCDAFVHAGDQETFGLIVLEAMACGLPVVAARAGALVELVDESVGETFQPRNPSDLARAVQRLFERDRVAIGRAARRRAETHSWDTVFTQLLGRYTRLMSSQAPVSPRLTRAR